MIHMLPHTLTDGLVKETEACQERSLRKPLDRVKGRFPSLDSYLQNFVRSAEGRQFAEATGRLRPGSRILDIGSGFGAECIYLAGRGHRVSAVEPVLLMCQALEGLAGHFGLTLDIYNVSAEHLDRLPVSDFDACIFNASLHHCDDPAQALQHCHDLLASDGTLFVLNEPHLPVFCSKERFYRVLASRPECGDYGGNEHTYYYHEYRTLLRRAGFSIVANPISLRYQQPDSYLVSMRRRGLDLVGLAGRRTFYQGVHTLNRAGWIGRPLMRLLRRLSLIHTCFIARKRPRAA